jgi:hypothetical protein
MGRAALPFRPRSARQPRLTPKVIAVHGGDVHRAALAGGDERRQRHRRREDDPQSEMAAPISREAANPV